MPCLLRHCRRTGRRTGRCAAGRAGRLPSAEGKWLLKLTLKMPCYLPVMQFAQRADLRESSTAPSSRAPTNRGDARKFDNTALINEILALRKEEAQPAGLPQFWRGVCRSKDGEVPAEVIHFLRDLAHRARPTAEKTWPTCANLPPGAGSCERLKPGIGRTSRNSRKQRYAFSKQEVKAYFTAPKVLRGCFKIIETLF